VYHDRKAPVPSRPGSIPADNHHSGVLPAGNGTDSGPYSPASTHSGGLSAREIPQRERETRERDSDPPNSPAKPQTSRGWVHTWYAEFARRTAQTLEPGPEAYADAAKAWKRAKPETLVASVPVYFDVDFWFTRPKRGSSREFSFRNYCAHLEDIISAMSANGSGPPKPSAKLDVRRCPNGHNYIAGDVCMECGFKEPKEDDDGF
jgi:hypothetical protein